MVTADVVWRTANGARQQMGDALLKNSVRLEPDGIQYALGFQVVVDDRRSERRVATKVEPNLPFFVSLDHRFQDIAPAIGTVDAAGT